MIQAFLSGPFLTSHFSLLHVVVLQYCSFFDESHVLAVISVSLAVVSHVSRLTSHVHLSIHPLFSFQRPCRLFLRRKYYLIISTCTGQLVSSGRLRILWHEHLLLYHFPRLRSTGIFWQVSHVRCDVSIILSLIPTLVNWHLLVLIGWSLAPKHREGINVIYS